MDNKKIQTYIDHFTALCQGDSRVIAAFLYGSYASGAADPFSDLDLCLVTREDAFDGFIAGRETFIRSWGEPLFLEDFDLPNFVFIIFQDGLEVELRITPESQLDFNYGGPNKVLLDKLNLSQEVEFPGIQPAHSDRVEALRRQVYWFWHDLSHFITAMGRGQLWWGYGQLEELRRYCMNLVRLRDNFWDVGIGEEPYFKLEVAIPVEQLSPLAGTFCPLEADAMLKASLVILKYYKELAIPLAHTYAIPYPDKLEEIMVRRLEELNQSILS
jgi:predicted nucleotidyltransferase